MTRTAFLRLVERDGESGGEVEQGYGEGTERGGEG